MITENLSTLKLHKLTQEQYNRELSTGNIDKNAFYLTPDSDKIAEHTHWVGEITDLPDMLADRAPSIHGHTASDIYDMADYIIGQSLIDNNSWFRQWNSGLTELWLHQPTVPDITNNTVTIELPPIFMDGSKFFVQSRFDGNTNYSITTGSNGISIYVNTNAMPAVDLYIVGRWK